MPLALWRGDCPLGDLCLRGAAEVARLARSRPQLSALLRLMSIPRNTPSRPSRARRTRSVFAGLAALVAVGDMAA
jgi:hypothetical protein